MNKELILKYKNEFDYWVNGGKILMHYGKWVPVSLDAKWEFFIIDLEIIGSFGYIIDDKYVEFRKALAEGKTIQCNAREGQNDITYAAFGHLWWVDVTEFKYATNFYRIKPEESKFKVDDYIYDIPYDKYYRITNILEDKVETETFRVCKSYINGTDYKLWKPKVGELVIMSAEDYSTGFTVTTWEENSKFVPVPFTGELPK